MNFGAISFFQPAILSALGFLGVILFLHFFKRKTVKKMEVSTLRFFPSSAVNRSRVRKIADILLLLARLLLALIIVLLFAGLHDRDDPLAPLRDPYGVVYVWIDQTMSMEYFENGNTAITRAAQLADTLSKILPPAARLIIYDEENGIAARHGAPDVADAADAFMFAAKEAQSRSAVFIAISDFQKSTTEIYDSVLQNIFDNDKVVINVTLAPREPFNYAVRAHAGASLRDGVTATIYAHGAPLAESLVELYIGELRVGQKRIECAADDSVTVTFDLPATLAVSDGGGVGISGGVISLEAVDPLPFDNRAFFSLDEDARRTALIIGNTRHNSVIEAALRVSAQDYWQTIKRIDAGELSYDDLNEADLIIVNNFYGRSRVLESFISGAGAEKGIIVTLDPDREDDFGRTLLRGASFSQRTQNVRVSENGARPILSDTSVAPWRGFPAPTSRNARVYRYITPIPGNALARLGGQHALVTSQTHNGGNVVFVSTPLGITRANNLSETGFYVPFIDRVARYALSGRGQNDEVWYAGGLVRNPFFGGAHGGAIYDANGKLVVTLAANQPFVGIAEPGIYSLVSPLGETLHKTASAHPRESEMEFIKPFSQNARGIYYFEYERFLEQLTRGYGDSWARRLWIVLCLLICAEVFLWKRK